NPATNCIRLRIVMAAPLWRCCCSGSLANAAMTDISVVLESSTSDEPFYDVAVVGYGPTGATLSNLLALQGLSVLVLEREADIYRLPRAIHFDGEAMRVFQTVGIAEALEPTLFVAPGMQFLDAAGNMLIDWRRPAGVRPQG